MTVLAIASVYLRRMTRDRIALFFIVVLPVLVILVIGATVGGFSTFNVGLVDKSTGPLTRTLVASIRGSSALDAKTYTSIDAMKTSVRRSEIQAGIYIPPDTEARLRAGRPVTLPIVGEQANSSTRAAFAAIAAVVASHGARVQAAAFATGIAGGSLTTNLDRAEHLAARIPSVRVRVIPADTKRHFLPDGFNYSAPTMLVLFVFINSLAVGAIAIGNRQLGLYERFIAAPVHPASIVLGEAAGAFTIAMLQSVLIVTVGAVLFGVHWGNPIAATVLILVWALVGTGAGMVSGAFFRTPEQATAIGPPVGIALGMLGGCMWPLEIVGSAMKTVGHFVPQAWAVDAWTELLSRGGGLADISRQLWVLSGFAVAFMVIASLRMRRALVQ